MSEWTLHGEKVLEQIENGVDAENLSCELKRYQKFLGKEFGITELLKVHDIKAKGRIAEAICNVPEFFVDQVGKARNTSDFPSICSEFAALNHTLEQFLEDK